MTQPSLGRPHLEDPHRGPLKSDDVYLSHAMLAVRGSRGCGSSQPSFLSLFVNTGVQSAMVSNQRVQCVAPHAVPANTRKLSHTTVRTLLPSEVLQRRVRFVRNIRLIVLLLLQTSQHSERAPSYIGGNAHVIERTWPGSASATSAFTTKGFKLELTGSKHHWPQPRGRWGDTIINKHVARYCGVNGWHGSNMLGTW